MCRTGVRHLAAFGRPQEGCLRSVHTRRVCIGEGMLSTNRGFSQSQGFPRKGLAEKDKFVVHVKELSQSKMILLSSPQVLIICLQSSLVF